MIKFSIIVPVYNVEKYIEKCLESINRQTYGNFEVIIVNDGTKDNSIKIAEKYLNSNKNFKLYNKKNGGLSDARNYGLKYVTGDYILFVDSDDYLEYDFLNRINRVLSNEKYDLVKFKINLVSESYEDIRKERGSDVSKEVSLNEIFKEEFCEPACAYCYKSKFWKENNFKYAKGMVHEDFGLTPEILMKANTIYCLNYYGYNYVQRENSIMSSNDGEKIKKKAYDMLKHFDRLINVSYSNRNNIRIYNSFLANAVISKINTLNHADKKEYIGELKKRKVSNLLLTDTVKRKIKKIVYKIRWRF